MNQTFSFARFARLHRWLWATKARTYLIGLAVLVVIGGLNLSRDMSERFTTYSTHTYESHLIYFIVLSIILAVGIGSDVFSVLFRQESAIAYLMLPASRTEKFWLGVAYCLVALIAFTAFYFGYELFVFSVANSHLKAGQTHYVSYLSFSKPNWTMGRPGIYTLFYFLLLAVGLSLLGSFYFRKGVLVRNIGGILLLLIGIMFLYNMILGSQFGGFDIRVTIPIRQLVIDKQDNAYDLYTPLWVVYLTCSSMLLAFWAIARVRFNEIER